MYSNTIYILNNTIIECFDIAFNKTRKTLFSPPPSFCGIPDAKKNNKNKQKHRVHDVDQHPPALQKENEGKL